MRPIIKSFMFFLLMIGLVAFSGALASISPFLPYTIYIILIFLVCYLSNGLYWGKNSVTGLVLGSVLIGTIFSMELIAGGIKIEGYNFDPGMLVSFLFLQAVVAMGEELSFRGYILKNLIEETGIRTGILLSSFMFSAIHIPTFIYYGLGFSNGIIAFAVVGMLGAVLGMLYVKQGLKAAIGFHFAWNFFQYNIFTMSYTQPGLFKSAYTGSGLLTGGSYGPEAGIPGLILIFFILVIFIKRYSKSLN
ncbi:CAAX protease self-immunity [uncultured archaeon]|nr:CAAX protease self-immunity [uncultured archaeon]